MQVLAKLRACKIKKVGDAGNRDVHRKARRKIQKGSLVTFLDLAPVGVKH